MLPTLGLASAAIGLLLIIFLIYSVLSQQLKSRDRNLLALVSVVSLVVAGWHIVAGLTSSGGH